MTARRRALAGLAVGAALAACAPEAAPLPPEEAALPDNADPARCAKEPFEQLRVGCLVETGARAAREGNVEATEASCAALPEGTWKDECHFRAGEELARAGEEVAGLSHCGRAGRFATFCTTHAGWGIPVSDEPVDLWLSGVPSLPEALREEGADILRSRWWYNRVYGTGTADPAVAKAAPPDQAAHARGAWAIEAIRLLDGDHAAARAAWAADTVLTGARLDRPIGRYDAPFRIDGEVELARVRTFGGSARLLGETPEEDLDIALLEGLYFREATRADPFVAFLSDPRPRVRYTAIRAYRTLNSPDAEAVLTAMKDDPDPIVAAHVADALQYRTWEGKRNAPGLDTFGAAGPRGVAGAPRGPKPEKPPPERGPRRDAPAP